MSSVTLLEKYTPKNSRELVAHHSKITFIKAWLEKNILERNDNAFRDYHDRDNRQPVLMLCGPSGCGKFTTVNILSKELGINVSQWTDDLLDSDSNTYNHNPFSQGGYRNYNSGGQYHNHDDDDSVSSFALRSSYCHLTIKSSNITSSGSRVSSQTSNESDKRLIQKQQQLVVIRDPSAVASTYKSFCDALISFRCPVIVIVSDSIAGKDDIYRAVDNLLPYSNRGKFIVEICYMPSVTSLKILKCLTRVADSETSLQRWNSRDKKGYKPDKSLLQHISEQCNGDIRQAILQLQLHLCSSGGLNTIFGSTSSSISNILTSQKEDIAAETGPDATYSSLHGIAKLLHSKLDDQHQRFSFNCDRLIESFDMPLDSTMNFLHQNCVAIFQEDGHNAAERMLAHSMEAGEDLTMGEATEKCQSAALDATQYALECLSSCDIMWSRQFNTSEVIDRSSNSFPVDNVEAILGRTCGVAKSTCEVFALNHVREVDDSNSDSEIAIKSVDKKRRSDDVNRNSRKRGFIPIRKSKMSECRSDMLMNKYNAVTLNNLLAIESANIFQSFCNDTNNYYSLWFPSGTLQTMSEIFTTTIPFLTSLFNQLRGRHNDYINKSAIGIILSLSTIKQSIQCILDHAIYVDNTTNNISKEDSQINTSKISQTTEEGLLEDIDNFSD